MGLERDSMKVKGSKKAHAELDAKWQKLLVPGLNFWQEMTILQLWRAEKVYLSTYGQLPTPITNIKSRTNEKNTVDRKRR